MSSDFKNSGIYKSGLFYKELGDLLMNPGTTIDQISEFAFRHNNDYTIKFSMLPEQPTQDKENSNG